MHLINYKPRHSGFTTMLTLFIISILLFIYLGYVLIKPEKF